MLVRVRPLAVAAGCLSLVPVVLRPLWKENGWISTCAGIGCLGRHAGCATYNYTSASGEQITTWCYWD